jgi:hypothetical protein
MMFHVAVMLLATILMLTINSMVWAMVLIELEPFNVMIIPVSAVNRITILQWIRPILVMCRVHIQTHIPLLEVAEL